jgi:alpha-L-fucosidase
MLEMVYSLQPEIIVNDRLSFHKTPTFYGDYATPEVALPNKQVEINGRKYDWETCMTMNNSWGYSIEDNNFKDPAVIVRALTRCVSMNGNLLLNIGPDSTGRIPPESVSIFKELGKWMKAHSRTVHGCSASEFKPPPGCSYTENNDNLFLHMHNPAMGDIILPGLKGRVERIRQVSDGSEIPMITHWGFELLEEDELRIRPPKHLAGNMPAVLQIKLKKA